VATGYHHDRGPRQLGPDPEELLERVQYGGVGGARRVKDVAGNQHDVGSELDDLVYGALERLGDVGLTLVYSRRCETLVLAIAKVEIGEMY
jgi:hypothetical protein